MSKVLKAHISLILVNLLYGGNYVIAKEVTPEFIEPFGFIVIRASCAAILFYILHRTWIKEKVDRKDWFKLFLCGLFGVAINQLLFFKGLSITSPINAALMMITTPILVLLMASLLLKEKITFPKALGIFFGALGAGTIVAFGQNIEFNPNGFLGDLFIFINAASYAIYLVIVKPLMKKYHPITVMKWTFSFGLLFIIPVGYREFVDIAWSSFQSFTWFGLGYVVIGVTFFAYLLNTYALKSVSPTVVSIYIYTQPIIATTIALSLGKDEFIPAKAFAALFIFVGVFMVSYDFRKRPLQNHPSA